ncbi:MAG: DEAD/DEAH box helicase [Candidatus Marsarchaeota archaeon]|nr:DEAD/DEAH box helicase [Candidatus Marsarchaeota archaeon]
MYTKNSLPPLVNSEFVEPRTYQLELYSQASKKNTLVVLPTGLGKTTVAALLIAQRLEENMDSKAVVLAPTRPLVDQHLEFFRKAILLDRNHFGTLTGGETPAARVALWERCKLLVCTPQVVRNDLVTNRYSLSAVSTLVLDEAHRTVGDYPYTFIVKRYLAQASSGLILGLTASPSSTPGGVSALARTLGEAQVVSRTHDDADVRGYVGKVDTKLVVVDPPQEFSSALGFLYSLLERYVKPLKEKKLIAYSSLKSVPLRALIDLQRTLAQKASQTGWDESSSQAVVFASNAVRVIHALTLFETQGVSAVLLYMQRMDAQVRQKATRSLRILTTDPYWVLTKTHLENLRRSGVEHPKLAKLCELLSSHFSKSHGKVIVFTNYRDTSTLVTSTLLGVPGVRPVRFVGQADRGSDQGLSQKEQKAILDEFKAGKFNVLVATQVAEEGLDTDECELVVMYDTVPSSIRLVQRMGRTGRKRNGAVVYLVTRGTRDEAFYWIAKRRRDRLQAEMKVSGGGWWRTPGASLTTRDSSAYVRDEPHMHPTLPPQAATHAGEGTPRSVNPGPTREQQDSTRCKSPVTPSSSVTVPGSSPEEAGTATGAGAEAVAEVVADTRESASTVLEHLVNLGVNVHTQQLGVADYVVSDVVCVERKSTDDFASSILDGRLFEQALNMRRSYRRPILIVEGETLYTSALNPESVRGALISLAVDYGIPILWSRTPSETARFIMRMAVREQKEIGRTKPIVRDERKPVEDDELREYVVSSLPGVDAVRSRRLLKRFGSVSGVFNADLEALLEVEGIGEKTARRMKEIIEGSYRQEGS